MNFLIKLISLIILVATVYIVSVFIFPTQTDYFANLLWIDEVNVTIRNLKNWTDSVSENLIRVQKWQEIIDYTKKTVKDANDTLNKTQKTITNKIDQANKTIEAWKKVIDASKELKQNVDNLSSTSWIVK